MRLLLTIIGRLTSDDHGVFGSGVWESPKCVELASQEVVTTNHSILSRFCVCYADATA